ncbi:MAG TPA: glycosyltransferase [Roseiflexaceae bacterium]|nr:glycosyltransferase [Roseiflexaceae bacterium]
MPRTVFHFTDTTGFGGAEQAMLHLLAGTDRQRWHPVLLYHPSPGIAPLLERAHQINVELRPVPALPLGLVGALRIPQFASALRARRPDVFHAHLTWPLACKYGLVAASLACVPAVIATVQLFMNLPYDRSTRLQQRLIASRVDAYVAVSCHVARQLRQTFHIPRHKVKVIHNAVPLTPYLHGASTAGASLADDSNLPSVLTVARLDEQKGLDYLLAAAALIPDARFFVAGDGPERARLEAYARALGLDDRVAFLGYRSDIPDLLSNCDLFVLPSLFEGLPLSILEAMVAGKPVITSAIGGTDEVVIHEQTGLLVPPGEPIALARAIRAILDNPPLGARLAQAGQARVRQQFAAETMIQHVTQLYEEVLGRP